MLLYSDLLYHLERNCFCHGSWIFLFAVTSNKPARIVNDVCLLFPVEQDEVCIADLIEHHNVAYLTNFNR